MLGVNGEVCDAKSGNEVSMKTDKKALSAFLWENVRDRKYSIVILLLVQIYLGAAGMLQALLLKELVDCAVEKETGRFFQAMCMFSVLIVLQVVARSMLRHFEESVKSGVENRLKERLFRTLLHGDYAKVTAVHSGEWMTRLTSDTVIVADGTVTILPGALSMIIRLLGAVIVLFVLIPGLCVFLTVLGAVVLGFTSVLRKIMKSLHKAMQEEDGKLRVFLQEYLGSLMIIKVFRAEDNVCEEAASQMVRHRRARMQKNRFSNICSTGFGAMLRGAYLLGAIGCGYGIMQGAVSYGTFTAVLQLINQLQVPLAGMSGYVPRYYAMLASVERLMEAEQYIEDLLSEKREESVGHFSTLKMENVGFSYPGKQENVLRSVDFELKRGEFVALIGGSGSGKSTLMKLLLGLYPVSDGEIQAELTGGQKRIPSVQELRQLCTYVPQGNRLMKGTIREIVALGNKAEMQDDKKIKEVLQTVCAEFVWTLPDGIDTELGEQGAGLSEGQLQRLSIARALFLERPIIILDEATSALDEATEKQLLSNIRKQKDRTVLLATHRPAALEICDRVVDVELISAQQTVAERKV